MTTNPIGRRAALGVAAATAATLARPAIGQGRFPNRPVRFLIPWAPGGTLDGFMRLQAELFQQETGQSSYWFSSGGSRDAAKPASALTVGYALPAPVAPSVTSQPASVSVPAGAPTDRRARSSAAPRPPRRSGCARASRATTTQVPGWRRSWWRGACLVFLRAAQGQSG